MYVSEPILYFLLLTFSPEPVVKLRSMKYLFPSTFNSESFSSDVFNSSLNKSKLDQLLTEIGCQQTLFEPFNKTLKGFDFATFNKMCKNNFNQLPF